MPEAGLATASSDAADTTEIINRKIAQANAQLEMDLISRVQKCMAPYQVDAYDNTPSEVVATITTASETMLNQCAITYTIRAMFEEGESRMRFRYEEAGDSISRMMARWDKKCKEELDKVFPLLLFDVSGDGTITTAERLFTNQFSSVRVTM
jgi:hypothetical protein